MFWLEFMLLPILGTRPTLLVMDLFKSHNTQEIKDWLRTHGIVPSLVPGGCTGLVQPLDVSVNRPFKDILKQFIDDTVDLDESQPTPAAGKKDWQSVASKMRVMMTMCVGEAWEIFNREKRDVVIRSFRCLGIALPIDGSCDNEISIKELDTSVLAERLKKWERTPTVDSSSEGTSNNLETDTSNEDELLLADLPLSTHMITASGSGLLKSPSDNSDDDTPLKTTIRGNRRGRPRGRGRGSQRSRGKSCNNSRFPSPLYLTKLMDIKPLIAAHSSSAGLGRISAGSVGSAHAFFIGTPSAGSVDTLSTGSAHTPSAGSAEAPSTGSAEAPSADSAGSVRTLSADAFLAWMVGTSSGKLPVEPVSLARRSKRLEGVRRQYVVEELFPSMTDDEDDDDGVEFCWRDEV